MRSRRPFGQSMACDFEYVGHHRRRRRHLARAESGIHCRAKRVAMDIDRVERAADARQQMATRDHRRMHPRFDSAAVVLANRQQFDRVAKLARVLDIGLRDLCDPFGVDLRRLHQHAESQRDQQTEFVRRVVSFDIDGRIRLGQAFGLRVFKRRPKLDAALRHRGENRIAGPVDDSINGALSISRQRFPQRADDRHAAADAGLEADREAVLASLAKNLAAVLREQSLVAGDDVLARRERLHDQLARRLMTAK